MASASLIDPLQGAETTTAHGTRSNLRKNTTNTTKVAAEATKKQQKMGKQTASTGYTLRLKDPKLYDFPWMKTFYLVDMQLPTVWSLAIDPVGIEKRPKHSVFCRSIPFLGTCSPFSLSCKNQPTRILHPIPGSPDGTGPTGDSSFCPIGLYGQLWCLCIQL